MYNKSFQILGLIIVIITCFFTFILSFNISGIKDNYKAAKNEYMEMDKDKKESKNINTKFLGYPYLDENNFNNTEMFYKKDRGVLVRNYGNYKNTNNVNKNYKNVYKVIVHIGSEVLNIYNNNELIKIMALSIGMHILSVPMGIFVTSNKGNEFFSSKYSEYVYYWTSIKIGYDFNSFSFYKNENIMQNQKNKISNDILHKNLGFSFEDTKWNYSNNVSRNSKVCFKT